MHKLSRLVLAAALLATPLAFAAPASHAAARAGSVHASTTHKLKARRVKVVKKARTRKGSTKARRVSVVRKGANMKGGKWTKPAAAKTQTKR